MKSGDAEALLNDVAHVVGDEEAVDAKVAAQLFESIGRLTAPSAVVVLELYLNCDSGSKLLMRSRWLQSSTFESGQWPSEHDEGGYRSE